jgi:hypothetical protein
VSEGWVDLEGECGMTKASRTTSRKKAPTGKRKRKDNDASTILGYQGQNIIVDTIAHFIYIGKLEDVGEYFLTLRDADVHDRRESPSMNEKYILESKKYGVRCNRKMVHIRLQEVISISLLDDVIEY